MRGNRRELLHERGYCLVALAAGVVAMSASLASGRAQPADPVAGSRMQTDKALNDIRHDMALSKQRADVLAAEVRALRKDQKTLTEAMIRSAGDERRYSRDIRVSRERLQVLEEKQNDMLAALGQRRGEFAEVLAALQRMGLNPPPAVLVHSDDALQSVRSAVLLGAVVPEVRARVQILVTDLKELETVTASVRAEQARLAEAVASRQAEKRRLSLLLVEKARLQKQSEENLMAEEAYTRTLAEKAKSLQALLAELQRQPERRKPAAGRDGLLLQTRADFAALQGLLPLPVDGRRVESFGRSSRGEVIETEPGAVVTSPVEGIVRYAGPFRSYGQLLIIDAGHNYHMILAGLERIDAAQGQLLLQGEPVGVMGARRVAGGAAFDIGKSASMLYIEIRKDGKPVNPAPWWAHR